MLLRRNVLSFWCWVRRRAIGAIMPRWFEVLAVAVDEDKALWNKILLLPVLSPQNLPSMVKAHNVKTITPALPSASDQTRLRIVKMLSDVAVDVKTMPTLGEIVAGEPINNIKDVDIEELLGTAVKPVRGLHIKV